MAAADPLQRQVHAAPYTVVANGLDGVFGTGGIKTAGRWQQGRNDPLITSNADQQDILKKPGADPF
jgi:hypothetical protein